MIEVLYDEVITCFNSLLNDEQWANWSPYFGLYRNV